MKNLIRIVFAAIISFTAKISMAQVNIGAATATKIVTQATVPNVTTASTTQKVVNQAGNVTNQVKNQTQASVKSTQVQADQTSSAAINGSFGTKNSASADAKNSTNLDIKKGDASLSGTTSANANGSFTAAEKSASVTASKTNASAATATENTSAEVSAAKTKTVNTTASVNAEKTKTINTTASSVNKVKNNVRVHNSANFSGRSNASLSSKKLSAKTEGSHSSATSIKAGKKQASLSSSDQISGVATIKK